MSADNDTSTLAFQELERHGKIVETVLSSIKDFAYTFDRRGRFVYANKALLDLWGLELKDAVGKNFFDLGYPADLAAKLQQQIEHVFLTRESLADKTVYTNPSGVEGVFEYIFTPVIAADGTSEFVAGSTRDITETQHMMQALERSESQFRQLADAMPQIVWAAQPDGTLDYYNRRWFEYIDSDPAAIEEARWDRYIHPEDLPQAYEAWTNAIHTGEPYGIEFRVRGADQQYRWFLVRALAIRDGRGAITRWFGTCTDIQDHKELQAQKESLLESERAARSTAEHASRMKDEFLATLSHELRTPLNAIFGWTQLLKRGKGDAEMIAEGIDVIDRNVRVQIQLIEDLLDMSRIISGKLRLDIQHVELAGCVTGAIETVMPAAEAKGIRLEKILDPLAGPISGDPGRIQQVIWNLLSNAIKFTPKGGKVQVLLQRVKSHLEISVTDTGQGIHPEFLPFVFDRFRQADAATNRKHGGLGLGLAIVKQLVELHGGTIHVQSSGADTGTTFTVCLPLKVLHAHSGEEDRVHPKAQGPAPMEHKRANLAGLKALIIDDERDARELLRRLLEDCDVRVVTAGSASEGLALIKSERPDVVVSDIGMPGTDGYEFLRKVRALSPDEGGKTPAIALTAFARSEDRTKALVAGFMAHLSKPVEPSELLAMVATVTGRTGSRDG